MTDLDHVRTNSDRSVEQAADALQGSNRVLSEIETLKLQLKEKNDEIAKWKSDYNDLRSRFDELNDRLVQLDAYSRRMNLIFCGIPVEESENCYAVIKKVLNVEMALDETVVNNMSFQNCHRLPGKAPQPIIVRFCMYMDRERVWNAKSNLKKPSKIFIREDFPVEYEQKRKLLYPAMKKARQNGHRAFLKRDQLVVDGKSYTIKTVPDELNPAVLATPCKNKVTCFFSEASPLSNFYRTDITIDGRKYHSVEQYFQMSKALFAEKPNVAMDIYKATHPAICKKLGDKVDVVWSDWIPRAKEKMFRACKVKFETDQLAGQYLRDTIGTSIGEASMSKTWGIGLKLTNSDVFNKNKWIGQNVTGEVLMAVRKDIFE